MQFQINKLWFFIIGIICLNISLFLMILSIFSQNMFILKLQNNKIYIGFFGVCFRNYKENQFNLKCTTKYSLFGSYYKI